MAQKKNFYFLATADVNMPLEEKEKFSADLFNEIKYIRNLDEMSKLDFKIRVESRDDPDFKDIIKYNFRVTVELKTPPEDIRNFWKVVNNEIRRIKNLDKESRLHINAHSVEG